MNTNYRQLHTDTLQNRFGLRVAARLSAGTEGLPHDVGERLRVAREQAVARRKQPAAVLRQRAAMAASRNGNTATLSFGDDGLGFWGRLTSAAVVLTLLLGWRLGDSMVPADLSPLMRRCLLWCWRLVAPLLIAGILVRGLF